MLLLRQFYSPAASFIALRQCYSPTASYLALQQCYSPAASFIACGSLIRAMHELISYEEQVPEGDTFRAGEGEVG